MRFIQTFSIISTVLFSITIRSQTDFVSQDKVASKLESKSYKTYTSLGGKISSYSSIQLENPFEGKKQVEYLLFREKKKTAFFIPNTDLCIGFRQFDKTAHYITQDASNIIDYMFDIEKQSAHVLSISGSYPNFDKLTKELNEHIAKVLKIIKERSDNDAHYKKMLAEAFKETPDLVAIQKAKDLQRKIDETNAAMAKKRQAERETFLASNYELNPGRSLPKEINRLSVGGWQTYNFNPYYRSSISGGTYYDGRYVVYGQYKHSGNKYPSTIFFMNNLGKKDEKNTIKVKHYGVTGGFHDAAEDLNGDLVVGADLLIGRVPKESKSRTLKLSNHVVTAVCGYDESTTVALASGKKYYPHEFISNFYAYRNELSLIIWNHQTEKYVILPLTDQNVGPNPHLLRTKDGHIVLAYDQLKNGTFKIHNFTISRSFTYAYSTVMKVDIAKSFSSKKLTKKWSYNNVKLNVAELGDMIEDEEGSLVFVYKSFAIKHKGKYFPELHSNIYLEKLSSNGKLIAHYAYDHIEDNLFTEGGTYTPKNAEYIYMGWTGRPFIINNPKGDGYIVAHRGAYDVVKDKFKNTYSADMPLFVFHNKSLTPESASFLEQTDKSAFHKKSMILAHRKDERQPFTAKFATRDFSYDVENDRFVLTEEVVSSLKSWVENAQKPLKDPDITKDDIKIGEFHIWSIGYNITKDQFRKSSGPVDITADVADNSKTEDQNAEEDESTSDDSDRPKFMNSVDFRHDYKNRDDIKTIYIHYGSKTTTPYMNKTTLGNIVVVPCRENTRVYYSYTGKKSDMKFVMDLSPEDCGTEIKTSTFRK